MPSFRRVAIAFLLALTLVSCRRDPNTAKTHYLESGNKFFDRGRYKEAAIQYQNAIKIDPKFGPAHYRLGLVYLQAKPAKVLLALREYRRAVELLKSNQAYQEEYKQAIIRLSELNVAFLYKDNSALVDVQGYCDELFKKDPHSFDGFRLSGDLNFRKAQTDFEQNPLSSTYAGKLDAAMVDYRQADAVKPGDAGVAMQIATILQGQKQYAAAEPYFRRVIDKDKTSMPAYMGLYRLYMTEQKINEAEQLLKEAVRNNPKTPDYLERLAYHYGSLGRRDDMVNVLQQIKAHAKDFDAVNQVVGDFYLRMGDADSALKEYREGTVKDTRHKATYQHAIVEVLLRQGKRVEAADVNAQVLKENPKDADAKSLAATFLLDQGDISNALAQLQSVVTSSPDNAVAHYQLGRAYLASGRADARESARQQFERAIQLRQDMIAPRLGLAQLQISRGEFDGALDSVQQVLKRDPGNLNAKIIQSQAYVGQKKYAESNDLVATMVKSNPTSPDVYYQLGMSTLAQGKPKDAEGAFLRSYELNPANPKYLLGVVESKIVQGKPEAAMALLQAESSKYPNRLDILLLMGSTAQTQRKWDEALGYFNRVLSGLDKNAKVRADLYMQIANTYRLKGDFDSAVANLKKAREILPDNEIVLSALGVLLDQTGKKTDARQAYEASLKVNPNNPVTLNNLAFLMADTDSGLDMALNYAEKAKQLSPNVADISDTYGWILLKKGMPEQAVPVFKDLVSKYPAQSTFHYHLAMGYRQRGDSAKAAEELREALKHSPPPDELQKIQKTQAELGVH
jgi:tetratricopeptide (TPR) repeat protein